VNEERLLGQLEALAHRLDIEIRYESLEGRGPLASGGLCRLRGRQLILVNENLSTREKVRTIVNSLRGFDLRDIYVKPALRDLLESQLSEAHR
jgi:hypothetical protein